MTVLLWEFSAECLLAIGKPVTKNNLQSLVCWAVSEGSKAEWNPFDTEEGGESGESNYNSVGVKNYPTQAEGIDAFKRTILNGFYPHILSDLTDSAIPAVTCSDIVNSAWGSKPNPGIVSNVLGNYDHYANQVVAGSTPSTGVIGGNTTVPDDTSVTDATGQKINAAIVAGFPSKDGQGWYAVGADGGVYAQDGAVFHGSMGDTKLNKPIVAAWPTFSGKGYTLLAADGGTFNFGDAAVLPL